MHDRSARSQWNVRVPTPPCRATSSARGAAYSTIIIRQYFRFSTGLPILILCVKRWLGIVGLNKASTPGAEISFSSYAATLKVIGFLQSDPNPILHTHFWGHRGGVVRKNTVHAGPDWPTRD
ncbi:hypothetical protein BD413DRAFT_490617 [Trametes elegans]|nr:hypothetical protein BD413DRAFT_490617 [Trametes elegans]